MISSKQMYTINIIVNSKNTKKNTYHYKYPHILLCDIYSVN